MHKKPANPNGRIILGLHRHEKTRLLTALECPPKTEVRKSMRSSQRLTFRSIVNLYSSVVALVLLSVFAGTILGCGGSGNTKTLTVVPPSRLAYAQQSITATMNQAITADVPTVAGTVSSYAISPALPAGLSLNDLTGVISGTPTAVSAQTSYMVTASNTGGSTTATIQIMVSSAAPASLTYSQSSISAVVNQVITPDVPTVTGTVTSYSISPSLPSGLNIDSSTGVISGTANEEAGSSPYTVTASNSSGSTSTTLQIAIAPLAQATGFTYFDRVIATWAGHEVVPDVPGTAGTINSFTVAPDLPPGLTMDPATGIISGTPIAPAATATYVVTGSSSGGSLTATFNPTITVTATPNILLQLGNKSTASSLQFANSRVLSQEVSGAWVLWDYSSGAILARGDDETADFQQGYSLFSSPSQMAGPTLAIAVPGGIQVRASSDGHVLNTIVSPGLSFEGAGVLVQNDSWQLAPDGSYIAVETPLGLYIYTSAGQLVFSRTGFYLRDLTNISLAFAAPGQMQIANGPAAPDAIETVSVPGGVSSVSAPYQGQFQGWFTDGGGFITTDGTTVWTYSASGVQTAAVQIPVPVNFGELAPKFPFFGGAGNWIWTFGLDSNANEMLNIYKVGTTTPALTLDSADVGGYAASGTSLAVLRNSPAISVIDLSGAAPSQADYTLVPLNHASTPAPYFGAFAAVSSRQWVAGIGYVNSTLVRSGLIVDGASLSANNPRYFGSGSVLSISGGTGNVAVATGNGQINYFDPSSATPKATIALTGGKVELSSDGSVLAASSQDDSLLNIYSLPSGTLSNSFTYSDQSAPGLLSDFTLSGSGTTLGQIETYAVNNSATTSLQIAPVSGGPAILSLTPSNQSGSILLSPDGTLAALNLATVETEMGGSYTEWTFSVPIYQNGQLIATVGDVAVGWLDNGRLLVNQYTKQGLNPNPPVYSGCTIVSPTGVVLAAPPLPELHNIQPLTSDAIYAPDKNAIYSLTTGATTWTSPYSGGGSIGAVSGSYVVYEAEGSIVAVNY